MSHSEDVVDKDLVETAAIHAANLRDNLAAGGPAYVKPRTYNYGMAIRVQLAIKPTSQQELADALNVSRKVINGCCTGIREPSLKLLERLADFFGLKLSEIIKLAEAK